MERALHGSLFAYKQNGCVFRVHEVEFGESCVLIYGSWRSRNRLYVIRCFNLISEQWGEEATFDSETIKVSKYNYIKKNFANHYYMQSILDNIIIIEQADPNITCFVPTYYQDGKLHARKRFKVKMVGWHVYDSAELLPSILIIAREGIVVQKQLNASGTTIISKTLPNIPNYNSSRDEALLTSSSYICHMQKRNDNNQITTYFWVYSKANRQYRTFTIAEDPKVWSSVWIQRQTLLLHTGNETLSIDLETLNRSVMTEKYEETEAGVVTFHAPDERRAVRVRRRTEEERCEMIRLEYEEYAHRSAIPKNMTKLGMFKFRRNVSSPWEEIHVAAPMEHHRMLCTVLHILHCAVFLAFIGVVAFFNGVFSPDDNPFGSIERYGWWGTVPLYILRLLSFLVLPQSLFNLFGLILFNAFREKITLKSDAKNAPFICFRVVTRGLYPRLVKDNLKLNMETCKGAGIENFKFEVVTDNTLDLELNSKVREIVVPTSYEPKSGARFKARALQYCLEDDVNQLKDSDWIVHLDEETLLTENSIYGILNFCTDGRRQFGQGVITYANGEIVNWLTTLCDGYRVAEDMGKIRLQLRLFRKPLFGWKGSYVVSQVGAERAVSFDHGIDGSIAEDTYFGLVAMQKGYAFDFIEGEMLEKSPFTLGDFLQQRKRWLQGFTLTAHSCAIAFHCKILLALSLYSRIVLPFTTLQIVITPFFPLPKCVVADALLAIIAAINIYLYVYGIVKSLSFRYSCSKGGRWKNAWRFPVYTLGACLASPVDLILENIAVLLGLWGDKRKFFIVQKERQAESISEQTDGSQQLATLSIPPSNPSPS